MRLPLALILAAALLLITSAQAQEAAPIEDPNFVGNVQRAQVFDEAPEWTGIGNHANGAGFGYQTSDHTGGKSPGGEIGGTISSADTNAYYVDAAYRIAMTLNEALSAEGEFDFAPSATEVFGDVFGGAVLIGHRNAAPVPDRVTLDNFLGIELTGDAGAALQARAMLLVAGGDSPRYGDPIRGLAPDGDYTFRYKLDPKDGQGVLVAQFFDREGASLGTSTLHLTAAERAAGIQVDAFGIGPGAPPPQATSPVMQIDVYLDFLWYSVPDFSTCGPGCHA